MTQRHPRPCSQLSVLIAILALLGVACSGSDASGTGETEPLDDTSAELVADVANENADDPEDSSETEDEVSEEWSYESPWPGARQDWPSCDGAELVAGKTLAEKAAYFDWLVPAIHQVPASTPGHEAYSRVFAVNCDAEVPTEIVPDGELPFCTQRLSENNGLWTSLYVASQAFRYAATKGSGSGEQDNALAQLRRTFTGTYQQLLITGKAGLFARDFRDPSLPEQYCIEDEEPYASAPDDDGKYARYVPPDEQMHGNSFVRIDAEGCFETWDPAQDADVGGWMKDPAHCTDKRFAGFCWQRNGSKDELAGHMFAAGIVARLVDDPEIRAMAVDILGQVGRHLVEHDFWINDYDGRATRFGSSNALSFDEMPGSNAIAALAWIKQAASATGDPELTAVYDDCLLQLSGEQACIDQPFEQPRDYREYLDNMGLALGCKSNYDTVSIAALNVFGLVWAEEDPDLRALYRAEFRGNTKGPDSEGRDLWAESDPFKNFILVGLMEEGAYDASEAEEAKVLVDDGICNLKGFPADNIQRARDATNYPEWCVSPRHGSLAEQPIPIGERCRGVFEWWGDPNQREVCGEDLTNAHPPAGYLLPYWMGRYLGLIDPSL
jgi:hypothetical protein